MMSISDISSIGLMWSLCGKCYHFTDVNDRFPPIAFQVEVFHSGYNREPRHLSLVESNAI